MSNKKLCFFKIFLVVKNAMNCKVLCFSVSSLFSIKNYSVVLSVKPREQRRKSTVCSPEAYAL